MYEECMANVVKVLREGRNGGARNFCIAGDINVDFGHKDRGGFKKQGGMDL